MKGKRLCFGLLLALFIMLGLSLSVFSEDSSAVSDVTYTWSYTNHPELTLCGLDSNVTCSDFSYVIFHPLSSCNGSGASFYVAGIGSFPDNSLISVCSDIIAPIGILNQTRITGGVNLVSRYSGDVQITLTDSFGSSCPEIEPCPVIPEYPYEDDLANIRNAILLCGGAILVIYFFYAIYKMILGGL